MDAAQALADLTEISSQVEAAVLFGEDGSVETATLGDDAAAALAGGAARLLEEAGRLRSDGEQPTQLEVETADGSVFVVSDGPRRIAAVTGPSPTVGLVFYDLKKCLRDATPPKPKRARRPRKTDAEA